LLLSVVQHHLAHYHLDDVCEVCGDKLSLVQQSWSSSEHWQLVPFGDVYHLLQFANHLPWKPLRMLGRLWLH
jgi:hypothetical protein